MEHQTSIKLSKGLLAEVNKTKGKSMSFQSSTVLDSLEKLTNNALNIFDEKFINLPVGERNKKIMRDISGCSADLNKTFFLRKFEMNDHFQYKNYLKVSTDLVSIYFVSKYLIKLVV